MLLRYTPSEACELVALISAHVAAVWGCSIESMSERHRNGDAVVARAIAMAMATGWAQMSVGQAGRAMDRDHSCVVVARKKVARMACSWPRVRQVVHLAASRLTIDHRARAIKSAAMQRHEAYVTGTTGAVSLASCVDTLNIGEIRDLIEACQLRLQTLQAGSAS